jgi:hypothetical protein
MTAPKDDCASLHEGDIRLYDNYVPTLEVGDYLINVTQRINPNTNPPIDECYAASQVFSVQGPRYALPSDDIFSIFPPNNAQGIFDQYLPNVVLTKRDLPWERNVFGDADPAQQTPWLALLLFVEGEQIGGQDALLNPLVANWQPNRTRTANIPASSFYPGTGDGILWPELEREWYESQEFLERTSCAVIDLSPQAFAALLPAKADLRYLAHVRRVDPSAKDSDVLKVSGHGWYSILVGQRLPDAPPARSGQPGKLNIVHLVSLEGWQDYVTGQKQVPASASRVRMISFASWTFTCLPESGGNFSELMNGLLKDAQGCQKGTTFALPSEPTLDNSDDAQYASQALKNGYVPLRYQTRLGEQTFAWYRGPFSPVPVQNFISARQRTNGNGDEPQSFNRASSLLVYDKQHGVFDVSYGVAWETGRLLALSSSYFGQELLDWQRKGHQLTDLILERKQQAAVLKHFAPRGAAPLLAKGLTAQLKPYAFTTDLMTYLITQFSAQVAPKLYAEPPEPPAQPLPPYASLAAPPTSPQAIADVLTETDAQEAVRQAGTQELGDIVDWLAELYLLHGVPFENLVPHAAMLPPEAIRFFYLDSNWLDALIEGALSIGIESSRDRSYQNLMKDLIWHRLFHAGLRVRDRLFADDAPKRPAPRAAPLDHASLSGMLLRSTLVSGWPGLEVKAYAKTLPGSAAPDPASAIKLLRLERLSADVLLCLWPAVPAVVTIDEPREGVTFGFESPSDTSEGDYLFLRSLDPANYGALMQGKQYVINARKGIIGPHRLVKIGGDGGLLDIIRKTLPNSPTVNVRDFAVQMIKVPEQAVFAARPPDNKE